MIDTRVWMYRDGEAVCFAGPEAVPNGEGWSDRPVPVKTTSSATGFREGSGDPSPAEHLPEEDRLEGLRTRATALGIRYRRNAGIRKLTQLIEEEENHGPQS